MNLTCKNCNTGLNEGGMFKDSNLLIDQLKVKRINYAFDKNFEELCEKCGTDLLSKASTKLMNEEENIISSLESRIIDFPMFTVGNFPSGIKYYLKGLVTANVTVGTGLFNELSQGFNDFLGSATATSGMSHKANNGETTARAILVSKARTMKANVIIGVDIDYGTTANNAVTVNMQGTAALVEDLSQIYTSSDLIKVAELEELVSKLETIRSYR
jgi:uncharacterized protein YbjQ (UPF0145 family)